jgi:hypothetical protein
MRSHLIIVALAIGCSLTGCARLLGEKSALGNYYVQSQNLSKAQETLTKGDPDAALRILTDICASPAVAGVTDEALFRLALLSLRYNEDKEGETQATQASQALKRLQKDYPKSLWSLQAAPLADFISKTEELKRQNRNYRGHNQTLTKENQALSKENKELLQSIDKLKRLDLELEQKNR